MTHIPSHPLAAEGDSVTLCGQYLVRPSRPSDLPALRQLFACARRFMAQNGNPTQWVNGYPSEELLRADYKEFHIAGHDLAVSQITCLDSDRLMARKEEFLATMETIRKKNGLDIVLLMITNVLVEGSYLLYSGDAETIRQAFNITGEEKNSVFLPKIMSRKKQIIPSLSALWG